MVVADNDHLESAKQLVLEFAARSAIEITYCAEPIQNFALVRNRVLSRARGEFAAFIDDDEYPVKEWLSHLLNACEEHTVDGALGPVLPQFDQNPPVWIRKGGFYDRPRHATGFRLRWNECRTGNVLFRRSVLADLEGPFRAEFKTGGEDQDFFRRAMNRGRVFIWCDEAVVHEVVPPARWKRSFMLRRALLRGRDSTKHRSGRVLNLAKSMVAIPLYVIALPFLLAAGHHWFMKYLVKLCDHLGRLLAYLKLNPVRGRDTE